MSLTVAAWITGAIAAWLFGAIGILKIDRTWRWGAALWPLLLPFAAIMVVVIGLTADWEDR